ncbi:MAG TPA: GIY-YIG nuclease family protein, partial [Allocoleopsis sp.]
MEWKSWSSLPLTQRERLPAQSGIYVVVDAEEQIWYVGRSVNLNARWNGKGHHRYQQLSRTNGKRQYQIHWKCFPPTQLDEKEQFYIDLFKPHLNYSRVRTYARKSIQPHEEISRLLKVINKKTTLFPDVRSVVLGYYTEVDEDEEGTLKEYTCIIIVINVNDHDGPI